MTTRHTHETVETRLCVGLERTLPKPRIVEHFRTNGAADFQALWVLDSRLCVLAVEVKTTRGYEERLKPNEARFRRELERLGRVVAPSSALGRGLLERKPILMYAVFVYRGRPGGSQTLVRTTNEFARAVLNVAWEAGSRAVLKNGPDRGPRAAPTRQGATGVRWPRPCGACGTVLKSGREREAHVETCPGLPKPRSHVRRYGPDPAEVPSLLGTYAGEKPSVENSSRERPDGPQGGGSPQ